MRYGENPHQSAAFYHAPERRFGVATMRQLQGKQLSYNNVNDTDAAFECVAEFDPARTAAVVIVKHGEPLRRGRGRALAEGVREGARLRPRLRLRRHRGALNRRLDADSARLITQIFTEVIIAPDADEDGRSPSWPPTKKNSALLVWRPPTRGRKALTVRSVAGGLLVQDRDAAVVDDMDLKVVTKRQPTAAGAFDLRFAFRVAKLVNRTPSSTRRTARPSASAPAR